MYDELVKALRETDFGDTCVLCEHEDMCKGNDCIIIQAADAIESMSEAYDKLSRHMDDLAALMPRWIPVTERLPEKTGVYLAWMKWDLTEPEEEPSAYSIEYDAEEEAFGWWKSYYDAETLGWAGEDFIRYEGITHWMPLPEPPKEE